VTEKIRLLSGSEMSLQEHEDFKNSYACKFLMEFLYETLKATGGSVQFALENGIQPVPNVENISLVRGEVRDLMAVVNNYELLQQRVDQNKTVIESNGVK